MRSAPSLHEVLSAALLFSIFATVVQAVAFQQELSTCREVYSYIDANPVELNTTSGFRLQITDKRWAGGPILVERNFTWPPQPPADQTLNLNRSAYPTPAWARTTGELVPRISSDNTLVQLLRFNLTPYWNATGWRVPGGQGYLTTQFQLDLLNTNNTRLAYYPNTQQKISTTSTEFFYCPGLGAATEKDDDDDSGGLRPGFKALIAFASGIGFAVLLCVIVRIRHNMKNGGFSCLPCCGVDRRNGQEVSRRDLEKQTAVERFRTTPTVWNETPVTLDPGPSSAWRSQALADQSAGTAVSQDAGRLASNTPAPSRTTDWRSGGMVMYATPEEAAARASSSRRDAATISARRSGSEAGSPTTSPSAVPSTGIAHDFDQLAAFVRRAEETRNAERILQANDARSTVIAPDRDGGPNAADRLPADAMNGESNPPPAYSALPRQETHSDGNNARTS